jgi:hypothetical protein
MGGCCRVGLDTELEGGSKGQKKLEKADRGGPGPITGRSAIEEEEEEERRKS